MLALPTPYLRSLDEMFGYKTFYARDCQTEQGQRDSGGKRAGVLHSLCAVSWPCLPCPREVQACIERKEPRQKAIRGHLQVYSVRLLQMPLSQEYP